MEEGEGISVDEMPRSVEISEAVAMVQFVQLSTGYLAA